MQIVIGIIILIVVLTLLAAKMEAISHQRKMQILKTIALVFALLWLYETYVDRGDARTRALYVAFKQGKTLVCDGQRVTPEHFYFETGTESFVSTDQKGPLSGLVYPASKCEIADE